MYIKREIESSRDRLLRQGKVVLVTGARQVGKTTVLREHLGSSFGYVSMENPRDYLLAKQDAALFFESKSCRCSLTRFKGSPSCSRLLSGLLTNRLKRDKSYLRVPKHIGS